MFEIFLILAKEKLESQLELARKQEFASGGQPSDIMKRVGSYSKQNFKYKSYSFIYFRILFSINYLNWNI